MRTLCHAEMAPIWCARRTLRQRKFPEVNDIDAVRADLATNPYIFRFWLKLANSQTTNGSSVCTHTSLH